MFRISKRQLTFYGTVLAGTLMLLIPAFYNGYPLVNSDDGTYINSGFLPEVPGDRPVVYGLLLRIFSLNGISLWIALFTQAWTVSWLLLKIIVKNIHHNKNLSALFIYLLLTFCTSLSWVTSEIIPDICTPIALMAMYLILMGNETRFNTVLLYAVFLAASGTHLSHFLIFILLIAGVFLFKKCFFPKDKRAFVNRSLLALSLLSVFAMAVSFSVYSTSKHVFFMAALLDKGLLINYLDESCMDKNYAICKYKDSMSTDPNAFLWDYDNSPLYKEGGWAATKKEYSEIINGILSQPQYIALYIEASVKASLQQFADFKIGDGNFPFPKESHVYYAIKKHVPNDTSAYETAWQHRESIIPKLELPNKIIYGAVIASTIVLILLLAFQFKHLSSPLLFFIFICIAGIVVNVWDCATFAQVNGRYGCRVMWMLPFCALLTFAALLSRPKPASS